MDPVVSTRSSQEAFPLWFALVSLKLTTTSAEMVPVVRVHQKQKDLCSLVLYSRESLVPYAIVR